MISETSLEPTWDDGLIRQRLRVEAALQHQGVPVRFHAGQLWIPLTEGAMPIVIQRSASGGFRVEFRLTLGMCEATDGDLQQFVAAVNADRSNPIIEVRADGTRQMQISSLSPWPEGWQLTGCKFGIEPRIVP
jgi:hypothetical protein